MVLLVIDVQKGITDERLYAFEAFSTNVKKLIDEARKSGVEVIYVRHDHGAGSGLSAGDEAFEIYGGVAPLEGERIFNKKVNSSLSMNVGLLMYLRNSHFKTLIITGLQTDFCIDTAVKRAFDNGFKVIVPAGCNSTRNNAYMDGETTYKYYNESVWPGSYADCISVEETVSRMKGYVPVVPENAISPCGSTQIETERLILRAFRYDDADSMLNNWISDDEVQKMYCEPSYKTVEELMPLLDRYIGRNQSGYYYRWAVVLRETGECIGQVAYFFVDARNRLAEIEYCIGIAFQSKGYATEAIKAIVDYGFERIGLNKVQACVKPSNTASARVVKKCGFRQDGILRKHLYRGGSYEDRIIFSIIRDEH
jgi:RimJ/RimL family protein N-acetyltransferase/nicotinamidase-related amidase